MTIIQKLRIAVSESRSLGWLNLLDSRKLNDEIETIYEKRPALQEVTIAHAPPQLNHEQMWVWVEGYNTAVADSKRGK